MMHYYKCQEWEHPALGELSGGMTYTETNDDRWAMRQITVNGDNYIASNRPHPPWDFRLADQQFDEALEDPEDNVTEISSSEFEAVWQRHLRNYQNQWRTSKIFYPPGTAVQGWIAVFFPHGVIINLGAGTFGVADYAQCLASTVPEAMYLDHKVTAIVSGYDEVNQWLVLDQPRVFNERIDKG